MAQFAEHAYRYNTSPPGNMTEAYRAAQQKQAFTPVKPKRHLKMVFSNGDYCDWEDYNPCLNNEVWSEPTGECFVELNRRHALRQSQMLAAGMKAALGGGANLFPVVPLRNFGQLAAAPPLQWDMESLIGRGKLGLLVGKWGQFKTFLALDMAIALTTAGFWPVLADKGCRQYAVPVARRVLYIAAEGGEAEYHERLEAALQNRKEVDRAQFERNFMMAMSSPPLDTSAGQQAIVDMIGRATEQLGGAPEVIICDTLAKSMVGEENSNTEMGKVQRVADAIRRCLDCTFIFVHHTGKDGEKSGRGASVMPSGVDFLLHVKGDEETLVATVNVEKQKDAKAEKDIILQGRVLGKSLAFARITKAPNKKGDRETTMLMQRLSQIIEEGEGEEFRTMSLATLLAEEANDNWEIMDIGERKGAIEKMRGLIRRKIVSANTPEARDFRECYRIGVGANAKWVRKDATDD